MDNFRIQITAEGDETLSAAMALAFKRHPKAVAYAVRDPNPEERWDHGSIKVPARDRRLIFYWTKASRPDVTMLPVGLDAAGAADLARRWLAEQDYGREPDHDGDNGRGWRAYNEGWGHVDGEWEAFVAVSPAWAMYGK